MPFADIDGLPLHYEVEGEGEPLLLISGLGGNARVWAPVLPLLTASRRVIRVDNRGTGQTGAPPGPYTIDRLADDIAGLLAHLGLGPVDVVGWSLGGSVLQSLLIRHGPVLKRAVLLNAFPSYTGLQHGWLDCLLALRRAGTDPLAIGMFAMAWSFTPRALTDHDAVRAAVTLGLQDPHPTTVEGFEAQAHGLRRYDSRPDLPRVTTPTLVLSGAEDILTPPSQSIEIARLIPDARLQLLPRGGHAMILEYPQDTVAALLAWLGGSSG
jgi:pimeloyl-ACP methyl ester carboxylesterase